MQFKTKRTRSRRPNTDFRVPLSGNFESGAVIECEGVPYIRNDRHVDIVEDDTVIGAVQFKVGQRVFPALYGHKLGFIGETIDARLSGDGSTWVILLRVLDQDGDPVTIDECRVEMWFRESDLVKLDDVGVVSITPGHSINTNEVLCAVHTRKLVEFRAYHRVRDCDLEGPKRPDPEDDEALNSERRDVPEDLWRVVNTYADRPYTVEDPEWTEKIRTVSVVMAWLRQSCPRKRADDGSTQPYVIR